MRFVSLHLSRTVKSIMLFDNPSFKVLNYFKTRTIHLLRKIDKLL